MGRGLLAFLIVGLASAALVEIVAPAQVWTGSLMVHASGVLGVLAVSLAWLVVVTSGLRLESSSAPKIDQWFLWTALSWLVLMLRPHWQELAPTELIAVCLHHASYQLTAFAVTQFLIWSAPFETQRFSAFAWVQLFVSLAGLLALSITGRWVEPGFEAWRVLNVVGSTGLLMMLGRMLLVHVEPRSWWILGGALMALGILLTDMAAAGRGVADAWPVHGVFAVCLLILWLRVSHRMHSPTVTSDEPESPFEDSFASAEALWSFPGIGGAEAIEAGEHIPGLDARALKARRRIAKDLHERVGTRIASIISSLDPTDARQRAVASTLEHCLLDVKNLADDIEETRENLLEALSRLRTRVQHAIERQGIELVWDVDVDGPLLALKDERSRQVLHVVQEALFNAMRHSGATRVTVRCHAPPPGHALMLEIHDDGAGFVVPLPGRAGNQGLAGMHRRAGAVNGLLLILSEPGCGASVRLTLPL